MAVLKHVDFEVPGFGEFATPAVPLSGYAQAINALGPQAYWRFNEQSGVVLADQTSAHPLTLSGDYALGQDGALATHHDEAVRFNDGFAETSSAVLPTTASAAFSIVFWARRELPDQLWRLITHQMLGATTGGVLLFCRNNGILSYQSIGGNSLDTTRPLSTDWAMIVLTRNAQGDLSWYFDGDLDAQATGHTNAIPAGVFTLMPTNANQSFFYLDEMSIFDHALSAVQVQSLYQLGTGYFFEPSSS